MNSSLGILWQACPGGARILRVFGDSPYPSLPVQIKGFPVVEIGPYCFAQNQRSQPADARFWSVDGRGPAAYPHPIAGDFVQGVTLPAGVRALHNAAFYNCRKLEWLCAGSALESVGSDLFTNCRALDRFILDAAPDAPTGLKKLVAAVSADIGAVFAPGGAVQAKVFYPEYFEFLDENTPAHIFNHSIEGEGYRYRQCFDGSVLRFAVMREEPRLDPDEFDLGYYSYGLRTYGNLPLIEPLESRESKKIRDFVIVIDTSESTSGELVKAFLKETFGLLKTGESFFAKCNIAVMQCDDAVRDLTFLHSTDELDRFAACLTLTGGGGTDFRPAFAKIEELRRDGTLRDLQGVLYFTDGKGTYPTRRPPYETAFLFLETGTPPPDTPPWAMRLVLSPEEFLPDPVPKTPEIDWQENEAEDLPEL